jgi:hypothetical protein
MPEFPEVTAFEDQVIRHRGAPSRHEKSPRLCMYFLWFGVKLFQIIYAYSLDQPTIFHALC